MADIPREFFINHHHKKERKYLDDITVHSSAFKCHQPDVGYHRHSQFQIARPQGGYRHHKKDNSHPYKQELIKESGFWILNYPIFIFHEEIHHIYQINVTH